MRPNPKLLLFKQTAPFRSYFAELCLDISGDESSIVFSDIEHDPIGAVRFVCGPKYQRATAGERVLAWLRYMWRAFQFAFSVRGTPKLFIVAQPPFLSLLGYLQNRLLRREYFLWVDDVWPDVIVRQGLKSDRSWIIRLWRAFNRWTYRYATHVFTLGPYMKETVRQYVAPGIPITIVPTWVDTDIIQPIAKPGNPFAKEHGQIGKTTVMYSGNLGVTHDIGSILDAARKLRGRSDIHFMIIGSGPQWTSLQQSIVEHGDPNVTLLPLQPMEVLPYSLATAEIALISLERGAEGISMPSKTYYSMAAGSAIVGICAAKSDLAHIVAINSCGHVVEPKSPDDLAAAILRLTDSPDQMRRLRENSRRAAVELYSRRVNTARLKEIIQGKRAVSAG